MHRLPTALLRHDSREGSHYDWLLADPRNPAGLLWTARVESPSRCWPSLRCWMLTPIAPHRRIYLRYQGPLTRQRGRVTRIDAGTFIARLWTSDRIIIDLCMRDCEGVIELRRITAACWRAAVISTPSIDEVEDSLAHRPLAV